MRPFVPRWGRHAKSTVDPDLGQGAPGAEKDAPSLPPLVAGSSADRDLDPEGASSKELNDIGKYVGPRFDREWYVSQNRDLQILGWDPLEHYLAHGRLEGRRPNESVLPDVIPPDPMNHSQEDLLRQKAILLEASVFDEDWYAGRYGIDQEEAILHFLIEGAYEGNDPSPFFCSSSYYDSNPDIARIGVNPLIHYILHGYLEKRPGALHKHHKDRLAHDEVVWRFGLRKR